MSFHTIAIALAFLAIGMVAPLPAIGFFRPSSEGSQAPAGAGGEQGAGTTKERAGPRKQGRRVASWIVERAERFKDSLPPLTLPIGATLVAVGAAVCFTILYSHQVYPHLSEQYGGGAPRKARVLFSSAGASEAHELGLPIQPGEQVSGRVNLLFAGDSFYALQIPHTERVIQVSKSIVDGLLVDTRAPTPEAVATIGHRTPGVPGPGDRLFLTYSEKIYPPSLIKDWDGKASHDVTVQVTKAQDSTDVLRVLDENGVNELPFGKVRLDPSGYADIFGADPINATVIQRGPLFVITLKQAVLHPADPGPVQLRWTPSRLATDVAGNQVVHETEKSGRAEQFQPAPTQSGSSGTVRP